METSSIKRGNTLNRFVEKFPPLFQRPKTFLIRFYRGWVNIDDLNIYLIRSARTSIRDINKIETLKLDENSYKRLRNFAIQLLADYRDYWLIGKWIDLSCLLLIYVAIIFGIVFLVLSTTIFYNNTVISNLPTPSKFEYFIFYFLGVGLFFIVSKLIYHKFFILPSTVFHKFKPTFLSITFLALIVFGTVLTYRIRLYGLFNSINAAGLTACGYSFYILSMGFIARQIFIIRMNHRMSTTPRIYIVGHLINILCLLVDNKQGWDHFWVKQKILYELENIAVLFGNQHRRAFKSGDLETDYWFGKNSIEIAAGIRSLKKWILTPMENTREEFLKKITAYLVLSCRGEWSYFDKCMPEKGSRIPFLPRIITILRVTLIASLPFLFYLIIQRTDLAFTQPLSDYSKVGSIAWAALTVLWSMDPMFSQKISAMKDFTAIFPGPEQSKNNS